MARTHCHECDRGGNGNAADKCAAGWRATAPTTLGCYIGTPIAGEPRKVEPLTKAQKRYQRYLDVSDRFDSFLAFCRWETRRLPR